MDTYKIFALSFNFIIYLFMLTPIFYLLFKKAIYENKKTFISFLCISIFIETFLSCILYVFSHEIFSLFTNVTGTINYSVYSFKILFISSSLYGVKFLIPAYLYKNEHKKTAILVLSKIAVNILLIFIGYFLFDTKGILYSFPICDLIYYLIYIKLFLNIIR